MISLIRVEAVGDDPAQAKAEIDTILSHMRTIGRYEGIVPSSGETKSEVYEARDPNDLIRGAAGGSFSFLFQGRRVVAFAPEELPGNVPQMPAEQRDFEIKHVASGNVYTNERLVLDRLLPMDWPQQFVPRQFVDETESILYELRQMGMTCTIKPLSESREANSGTSAFGTPRWRIDVEYGDGTLGYHTVGPTIRAAAHDALNQAKGLAPTTNPSAFSITYSTVESASIG